MTTLNQLHERYHAQQAHVMSRRSYQQPVGAQIDVMTKIGRKIQGPAGAVYRRLLRLEIKAAGDNARAKYANLSGKVTIRLPGTVKTMLVNGTVKV